MSEEIVEINQELLGLSAQEIINWAAGRFGDKIALASSLGAEDMVLLDMVSKTDFRGRVFFLDTGRLHQETYELLDTARRRYGIAFDVYFPQREKVEQLVGAKGANSFYDSVEDRKECCGIRKIEPLSRALAGLDAWITGLRRLQSVTRSQIQIVEPDETHSDILKINPLVDWTEEQVWGYVMENGVPYNTLHDKGFPSIGCAPCTRAIEPGEDVRAGRWWWELPEHRECGLHLPNVECGMRNEV